VLHTNAVRPSESGPSRAGFEQCLSSSSSGPCHTSGEASAAHEYLSSAKNRAGHFPGSRAAGPRLRPAAKGPTCGRRSHTIAAIMTRSRTRTAACTLLRILADLGRFVAAAARSHAASRRENLFLRKQLALYVERQVRPRRADDATRIVLVALSQLIDSRRVLIIVKPDTLLRWHRKGFQLFWRWKSRPRGRPRVPADLQRLIAEIATANHTWGEERIAAELLLKLGIRVSPRTVRRYCRPVVRRGRGTRSQRWSTFVRNHASAVLAAISSSRSRGRFVSTTSSS
jgi:hypothetical protein